MSAQADSDISGSFLSRLGNTLGLSAVFGGGKALDDFDEDSSKVCRPSLAPSKRCSQSVAWTIRSYNQASEDEHVMASKVCQGGTWWQADICRTGQDRPIATCRTLAVASCSLHFRLQFQRVQKRILLLQSRRFAHHRNERFVTS